MKSFNFIENLKNLWSKTIVTDGRGNLLGFDEGVKKAIDLINSKSASGNKLIFVGNGGSAAISSHQATDYWKVGNIKAIAFNDSSGLTCIGNDFGYEYVFEKPIEMFGENGDILIAISSSGRSENILRGVEMAKNKNCEVITLSGFEADNPLRTMGDINFYVPGKTYGRVEVLHLAISHYMLDSIMQLRTESPLEDKDLAKTASGESVIYEDHFKIDSHKLMYHVERVDNWLKGENTYPIYVEISLSGTCNYRCTFCALDFMGYQSRFLDKEMLKDRLSEMARLGVKSVMYSGEGEPLLHESAAEIIKHTKNVGIDVAITTNGLLLKEKLAREILKYTTWIKVSINAGTAETYAKIHGTSEKNFQFVLDNIKKAVILNNELGKPCTIGTQLLLLPENYREITTLAEQLKKTGVDYLVIKPYSQHPSSLTKLYESFEYNEFLYIKELLESYNDENFKVVFRDWTMKKYSENERHYKICLALPFWAYIDAGGNLWGCSAYLGEENFFYGNIYKENFAQIWEGELRKKSLEFVCSSLDTNKCRKNCRMDEINRYLWNLKNPPDHVNFI